MKKLAKMLAVVLALVMVMGVMTACGGDETTPADENTPADTTPVEGDDATAVSYTHLSARLVIPEPHSFTARAEVSATPIQGLLVPSGKAPISLI